jgi:hypothetical protein
MENFDLRKYLAEGKLLKEDMASKAVSVLKSYKGEVKGLEDYIKYLMNTSDDISSSIQAVADDMDRDNDAEDSLRRDLEKLSLSEGKLLKENTNPIWTIEASEDDADISDAGLEYIRAVGTIIDKALPDISIEDMIASMDVINNFWHDEARKNAKGSEPEEIKVSAIDFADSVIEHYKDVLMDKDINESQNRMFDLKKYLAEGRLYENNDSVGMINYLKSLPDQYDMSDSQYDLWEDTMESIEGFTSQEIKNYIKDLPNLWDMSGSQYDLWEDIMDNFDLKKDLAEGKLLKENISKDVKEISIENHKDEALETISEFIDEFEPQGLFEFIPDLDNYEIDSSTNSLNVDELGSVYLISNEGPIPSEVKELMMDSNNGEMNEYGATWKKYPKRGYYYIVVS